MILDQADETAEAPVQDGRRLWWLSAFDESLRPPGRWPTPPTGRPRTARLVLRNQPGSPKTARDFALATMGEWALAEQLADDVTVVVSELVTNAVRYGLRGLPPAAQVCPIQFVLFGHARRLVLVVTDPSDQLPVLELPEPERFSEGGRGLVLVEALSSAWGWAPLTSGGKAVWAAFELQPTRTGP